MDTVIKVGAGVVLGVVYYKYVSPYVLAALAAVKKFFTGDDL